MNICAVVLALQVADVQPAITHKTKTLSKISIANDNIIAIINK